MFLKENIYFYKAESSSPLFFKPRVNNENQSIDLFSTDLDIRNDFEFDELDEEYFDNTDDDENEFEESEF